MSSPKKENIQAVNIVFPPKNEGDGKPKLDEGKPKLHLIPTKPLIQVARRYELAESKYGSPNNEFKCPMNWSQLISAALRHLYAFMEGDSLDEEDNDTHHLGAVVFCCLTLMEYERLEMGKDDRKKY